ncbi:MAG: hypothetical protein ABIG63_08690 [Chloroflexota bacterium]
MKGITWFDEAVSGEQTRQKDRMDYLQRCKPWFRVGMEYACQFSHNHIVDYSDKRTERASLVSFNQEVGSIRGVIVHLYLGKADTLTRDVGPIIEILINDHPDLKGGDGDDFVGIKARTWEFMHKRKTDSGDLWEVVLTVRAHYEAAEKCKLVGTGEFEEKMKLECEE